MVWLPDDEKSLRKYVLVSTQCTKATDTRRTGRLADAARQHRPCLCRHHTAIKTSKGPFTRAQHSGGQQLQLSLSLSCNAAQRRSEQILGLTASEIKFTLFYTCSNSYPLPSRLGLWGSVVSSLSGVRGAASATNACLTPLPLVSFSLIGIFNFSIFDRVPLLSSQTSLGELTVAYSPRRP